MLASVGLTGRYGDNSRRWETWETEMSRTRKRGGRGEVGEGMYTPLSSKSPCCKPKANRKSLARRIRPPSVSKASSCDLSFHSAVTIRGRCLVNVPWLKCMTCKASGFSS